MLQVGIGEYRITNDPDEILITHALGSCVALIMYCKRNKHTAMAHIVLPTDGHVKNHTLSQKKPSYFATEIIPRLVDYFQHEIQCVGDQLEVHVIGGADAREVNDVFVVGGKNVAMVHHLLKKYGILIQHQEIGGHVSRTVAIHTSNGQVDIKRQKMIL